MIRCVGVNRTTVDGTGGRGVAMACVGVALGEMMPTGAPGGRDGVAVGVGVGVGVCVGVGVGDAVAPPDGVGVGVGFPRVPISEIHFISLAGS